MKWTVMIFTAMAFLFSACSSNSRKLSSESYKKDLKMETVDARVDD